MIYNEVCTKYNLINVCLIGTIMDDTNWKNYTRGIKKLQCKKIKECINVIPGVTFNADMAKNIKSQCDILESDIFKENFYNDNITYETHHAQYKELNKIYLKNNNANDLYLKNNNINNINNNIDVVIGKMIGIDKKTCTQINKGLYNIDVKLDLHGYTLNNAYNILIDFIQKSVKNNKRLLLIITGKGTLNKPSVIKAEFIKWLNDLSIKEYIIYSNYAHQSDGGTGAFYVFLRNIKKIK